jgi:integrase/DNA-binding XRE family transcriptional regulator
MDWCSSANIDVVIRLQEWRERRGWSLRALGKRSGVHYVTLARIERGTLSPTVTTLEKVARALGIAMRDLFPAERRPPHETLKETTKTMTDTTMKNTTMMKGLGRIYRRGGVWWIRYGHRGQDLRESSGSRRKEEARALLLKRLQEIGRPGFVDPLAEKRVLVTDLLDAVVVDYQNNRRRSLSTLRWRLAPLRAFFAFERAIDVTEHRVERYKRARLDDGKAPATANRELAALRRAFRLGVRQRRITQTPDISLLAEDNVREGFIDAPGLEVLIGRLPDELQDLTRFAFYSGWRRGEITTLGWEDVDRAGARITLRRVHSKNGEPRVLPLMGELAGLIERRWQARAFDANGTQKLSPFVFHRAGRPIGDFRKAWATATTTAGLPGLLFHDLRRSAVRTLELSGVTQNTAMKLTGHKTASVYRRYAVTSEADLRAALSRAQATIASQLRTPTVTPLRPAASE